MLLIHFNTLDAQSICIASVEYRHYLSLLLSYDLSALALASGIFTLLMVHTVEQLPGDRLARVQTHSWEQSPKV